MIYLLLFLNIILLVSGQVLWKTSVSSVQKWDVQTGISVFTSVPFITGVMLYGFATFLWVYILSKLPLSVAYPTQSFSYVIALILSFFLFKEQIALNQWLGVVVIIFGVYLIAK